MQVKYTLTKAASALDPVLISSNKHKATERMKSLISEIIRCGHVDAASGDGALRQWKDKLWKDPYISS